MRRLLYLAALSVVATLAFASVAVAQQGEDNPCAPPGGGPAPTPLFPDTGGCLLGEPLIPVVGILNATLVDPDTGEELGIVKDLDPDLSSGAFSVTYQEFCGAFPVTTELGGPFAGLTAQEYYDQVANAKEQAILDPDGDGQACNSGGGAGGGQQDQYDGEDNGGGGGPGGPGGDGPSGGGPGDPGDGGPGGPGSGSGSPGGSGDGQQDGPQILPDTGGPAPLLPLSGLLVGSGILGLFVTIRRRA